MKSPRLLALGIASLLPASLTAHAGTDTWDGGGINDILTTPQNWLDDTAPPSDLANTDLIFAGAMRLTPTLNAPFSAHSITFDNTAGGFTILGEQINVGSGGIANSDPQPMSFANLVSFSGVAASSVDASNGGLTFGNAIGLPTGFLAVDGLGATNFQDIVGASTAALGKFGSGTMTWNPAGPVAFDIDVFDGALTITGAFEVNGSNVLVTGAGSTFSADTIRVSTGALTVSAGGDLSVSTEFSLGTAGSATLTIENGGTFTTGTGLTTVNATGDLNINAGGTMIVRGDMTVLSSLDIANGGVVILGATASRTPALGAIADVELLDFEQGEFGGGNPRAGDTVSAVPEPSVAMLVLTSLGVLGIRRRNKLPLFPIANHAAKTAGPT